MKRKPLTTNYALDETNHSIIRAKEVTKESGKGRVPEEIEYSQVAETCEKYGFVEVKSGAGFMVFENKGVRLKVGIYAKSSIIKCEIVAPNKTEILPFFIGSSFKSSDINIAGPHIHITSMIDISGFDNIATNAANAATMDISPVIDIPGPNSKAISNLEDVVIHATNAASMNDVKNADISAMLRPLYSPPGWSVKINTDIVEPLRNQFDIFKALLFETDRLTFIAYISALKMQAFEIEAGSLIQNVGEVINAIDKCELNEIIIMINLNSLEDSARNAVIQSAEKQLLYPPFQGPRFAYLSTSLNFRASSLPLIKLPVVFSEAKAALTGAGLPTDSHTVSELGLKTSLHGQTMAYAVESIQSKSKLFRTGLDNTANLRFNKTFKPPFPNKGYSRRAIFEKIHERLKGLVVGQEKIVREIAVAIAGWYFLGDTSALVFLFAGPSGAGKNHMAEAISVVLSELFEVPPQYTSFNCGSMVSESGLWQLTGVQAGLKGQERKGILERTEKGGVISFDELDKASYGKSNIQNFLIELLETGFFRNGFGEAKQLPPIVIVLTMNAGQFASDESYEKIGFGGKIDNAKATVEHYKRAHEKHLHAALRGRIQKHLFFSHLKREDLKRIAAKELDRLMHEFQGRGDKWPIINEVEAQKIAETSDIELGARGVLNRIREIRDEVNTGITGIDNSESFETNS